jgi:hypothetical protein
MDLTHLSDATLIDLASREDLTPRMVVVILAEVKRRNAVDDLAERKASLANYYQNSAGGSVLADYRAGNVTTIKA